MRFLTYNLWHGLSPTSPVMFEALEPTSRRALRERRQIDLLAELKPDLSCFQEVNPVARRVGELGPALNLNCEFQPDMTGVKLFGLGFPLNLNSGLVTASNRHLNKLAGVSLSRPGLNLVHKWASWQLREERFALFCELMIPNWGRSLVVNTHIHHGIEETPEFLVEMEKLAETLQLSPQLMTDLKERIAYANSRRAAELKVLLETLAMYEKRYEAVFLMGDFNASPESGFGAVLREAGFRDAWEEGGDGQPGFTFDSSRNEANHLLQGRFPLSLIVEDLTFEPKTKEALLALARRQETRPRRIDYVWFRSHSVQLKVNSAQLVGLPGEDGLAPSDHFGVCVDIERVG